MTKISFNEGTTLLADYRKLLESKIEYVCACIEFVDNGISWVIYEPPFKGINGKFKATFIGENGTELGRYWIESKEIWISTISIQAALEMNVGKTYRNILKFDKKDDVLANVIIDGITHYQTSINHEEHLLEEKREKNIRKYYQRIS